MLEVLTRMWAIVKKTLGLDRDIQTFDPPTIFSGSQGQLFVYQDDSYLRSIFMQARESASELIEYNHFVLRSWFEFESKEVKINRWHFVSVWKLTRDRPISKIPYIHLHSSHAVIVWRGGRYHNANGRVFLREVVFFSTYESLQMMGELDSLVTSLLLQVAKKMLHQPIESIDWARETSQNKYVRRIKITDRQELSS